MKFGHGFDDADYRMQLLSRIDVAARRWRQEAEQRSLGFSNRERSAMESSSGAEPVEVFSSRTRSVMEVRSVAKFGEVCMLREVSTCFKEEADSCLHVMYDISKHLSL